MSKFKPRTTGRTVVVGDEIYVIRSPATVPRQYLVSWFIVIGFSVMHALTSPWESLHYLLIMDINVTFALIIAWLFDDRNRYELKHVANRNMPIAGEDEGT